MSKVLTSGVLNRFDADQDGKITFDEFIEDRSEIFKFHITLFFFFLITQIFFIEY